MDDDPGAEISAVDLDAVVPDAAHGEAFEYRDDIGRYGHAYDHKSDAPEGDVEPTVGKDAAVEEDEGKFHGDDAG